MNTLNESGLKKIDIDLVKFFFDAKRFTLEELKDHSVGMFSTQMKLKELRDELLSFLLSFKNRNSIFYIFLNEEKEECLRIVISNVEDEPDMQTKRFAIVINEDISELKISQLSMSSKLLISIKNA